MKGMQGMWKSLRSCAQLGQHQKIHTDEKSYECKEYGEKTLRLNSYLKAQHSIHTNEKPYEC